MNIKHIALYTGAPLVALGTRLLFDNLFTNGTLSLLAFVIFLSGVLLVRFEDFPQGKIYLAQLETGLLKKRRAAFAPVPRNYTQSHDGRQPG
ncbi:MAG TPA: hypothetical protein G4N96_03685 [Chloroflexi bacterium]|nr:hypothetical protein [Chloroflexota bacterium]